MDFRGLEHYVDAGLRKQASAFGGIDTAENGMQVATNLAPYMVPVVGSGFMLRDAAKDFRKGHIGSGLWNTAVGIGTGALDILSLLGDAVGIGVAGHAAAGGLRAASLANKGAKGVRAAKALNALSKANKFVKGNKLYRFGVPVADAAVNTGFGLYYGPDNKTEWDMLSPRERGAYMQKWLDGQMKQYDADRAAQAAKYPKYGRAAQGRVHEEALPKYDWNYNKGTYERVYR